MASPLGYWQNNFLARDKEGKVVSTTKYCFRTDEWTEEFREYVLDEVILS